MLSASALRRILGSRFLEKLNALPHSKASGFAYRLPTREEWMYACRAGSNGDYCKLADGTEITERTLGEVAWYSENSGNVWEIGSSKSHDVGQKKPNAFGLYDMLGNISEFTSTASADGKERVLCGDTYAGWCKNSSGYSGFETTSAPDDRWWTHGLRLAADIIDKPADNTADELVEKTNNAGADPDKDQADLEAVAEQVKAITSESIPDGVFAVNGFFVGMLLEVEETRLKSLLPNRVVRRSPYDDTLGEAIAEKGLAGLWIDKSDEAFCFAKDGIVTRILIPKDLVKEWMKYGASSYEEWARKFAETNGTTVKEGNFYKTGYGRGASIVINQTVYELGIVKGANITYFGKDKGSYNLGGSGFEGQLYLAGWLMGVRATGDNASEGTLRLDKAEEL